MLLKLYYKIDLFNNDIMRNDYVIEKYTVRKRKNFFYVQRFVISIGKKI